MADPGASGPAKRVVRVDDGVWKSRLTNGVKLRFVARIPVAWKPPEARLRLGEAVGALVEEVQRAVDGGPPPRAGRAYVTCSKGAQQPNTVSVEMAGSHDFDRALRDRRSPRGWVQLPQPWGGSVAVFTGGPEEVHEAHLSGLDPFAPLEYTQEILRDNGIPPLELRSLPSREVKNV
ncbi:hypothetical protein ABPG75_013906, partial [Micractinium tetrahymenae]